MILEFRVGVDDLTRDLASDPGHAATLAEWRERLSVYLASFPNAGDTSTEADAETQALLESQGYL